MRYKHGKTFNGPDVGPTLHVSGRYRRARLALVLGTLLATGLTILASAHAAELSQPIVFSIDEKSLAEALTDFSRQADVIIIAPTALTSGKRSRAVDGRLTPPQALRALLQGTGLAYDVGDDDAIVISDASETGMGAGDGGDARTLDEVRVVGRLVDNLSMMKRGETMRETPQSVTIMTAQRIEEQNLTSISQVLEQAPGMTVETDFYNRPASFYARGFEISNMQVDGASVGVNRSYFSSRNLAMYEQVEVLRGADGLFAGSGDPGGTVNLVRKRGLGRRQLALSASTDRWDNRNLELDLTGPLGFDGRLRGRIVGQWTDRDFFYDTASSRGRFFYGTLEADVSDSTLVVVGASYEKADETAWTQGIPRYSNGSTLPGWSRTRSFMADWNAWDQTSREVFARVEQSLGQDWMLMASMTHGTFDLFTNYLGGGSVDPITGLRGVFPNGYVYDASTDAYDISISGKFDLFTRRHSVILGYDGYEQGSDAWGISSHWDSPIPTRVDPLTFRPDTIPTPSLLGKTWREDPVTKQHGFYGRVQLHVLEPLKLIAGARYSSFDYVQPTWFQHNADGTLAANPDLMLAYRESGIFTPYASGLLDIGKDWTVYASVTEIHKTQASLLAGPPPGEPLDAITGRNYEIGTKADLRDGRLGFTLSLYRIDQDGEGEQDPNYPAAGIGNVGHRCCYLDRGEVRSQGIDTEISGELVPGWSVFAGYTFNDNQNKREDATFQSLSPRHMFKLWTSYRHPSADSRWLLGGGVTIQSERHASGTVATFNEASGLYDGPQVPFEFHQGGYAVWNAMLQYRVNPAWTLSLNANNLLDKTYLSGLAFGSRYAEPRNIVIAARARF